MSAYADLKPAVVIPPRDSEIRKGVDMQVQFNGSVSHAISDHAHKIFELQQQVGNLVALIEWVGNTHPEVYKQYYALKDLERVSNE
jgi:hypothetical protein